MNDVIRLTENETSHVLLEVGSVASSSRRGPRLPYSAEQRRSLTALVGSVARAAIGAGQVLINGDTVKLVMHPELQEALKAGTAKFSESGGSMAANVMSSEGKGIVGNVRFKPADAAKLANIAGAAWQVAAVITAQHFMQEISGKLTELNVGLRSIAAFLDNQQNARLAAAQDTLHRDLRVYVADPTSEEDRRILADSLRRVFELAKENCLLRVKTISGLVATITEKNADDVWKQAEREARSYLFALTVGAEALAAARVAGQTKHRITEFSDSFEQSLRDFREVLDALGDQYQHHLDQHQPAKPDARPLWQHVVFPVGAAHLIRDHLQNRRHWRWKGVAVTAQQGADEFADVVDAMGAYIQTATGPSALLASGAEPMSLFTVLNGKGEVVEVYLERDTVLS